MPPTASGRPPPRSGGRAAPRRRRPSSSRSPASGTNWPRSDSVRALVVIGTRPEAIKLAPLVHALAAAPGFAVSTCVTSQHTDLLTPMLAFFGLRPDFDLKVMTPGQTLAGVTM